MGAFPHYGGRWAEWNGNFRDTVRSFIKGSEGPWAQAFASAVCASPTIYAAEQPGEGGQSGLLPVAGDPTTFRPGACFKGSVVS